MIYEATLGQDFPLAEPTDTARLRAGDPAAVDDLFQQTWLHVVRHIHRYDPARSFDTWLFAIAHNTAIDLLRRRSGESLADYPADRPDALDALIAGERAASV